MLKSGRDPMTPLLISKTIIPLSLGVAFLWIRFGRGSGREYIGMILVTTLITVG